MTNCNKNRYGLVFSGLYFFSVVQLVDAKFSIQNQSELALKSFYQSIKLLSVEIYKKKKKKNYAISLVLQWLTSLSSSCWLGGCGCNNSSILKLLYKNSQV